MQIGKKLKSKKQTLEYNENKIFNRAGCIDSLACVNCFYIISNTTCICAGIGVCPNCGFDNRLDKTVVEKRDIEVKNFFYLMKEGKI